MPKSIKGLVTASLTLLIKCELFKIQNNRLQFRKLRDHFVDGDENLFLLGVATRGKKLEEES